MSNVVLNIQNLSLQLDGKTLLDDVSFAVDAGKILAVIGPNGAGKTSLLNAVADTQASGVSALSGLVEFARRSLADYSPLQRARNMAVLPQHSRLSFPFAVEEVIALGRLPHSSGATVDQQLIQSVATDLDIDNLLKRDYTSLSGGEKQRVQLARVLAQISHPQESRPRLLLLDEPLNSLDPGHQLQVMRVIRKFAAEAVAVVIVLHDINMALRYADDVVALKNGVALAAGTVVDVVDKQLLQNLYGVEFELLDHPDSGRPLAFMSDGDLPFDEHTGC